jgi:phenol/toluene 2-monooxygenase (NADH) P2/A2
MTTPVTKPLRDVGIDLQDSEQNRVLIESIEADNESCMVVHSPGLVRISAPGQLVINRDTVEQRLGREWETHEFQMAIVSYFGHIAEWDDDQIIIRWNH